MPQRPSDAAERGAAAVITAAPSRPYFNERDLIRVCGLKAVTALFARDPGRAERLFFATELSDALVPARRQLARLHRPYRQVPPEELARIAGTVHHGGAVAIARPQRLARFTADAAANWAAERRLVLVVDGIGNPHNLGAIGRSAAYFGVRQLVLADRPEQALPSDASYRIAEGGLEYLQLYRAKLPGRLADLSRTHRLVGTAPEGGVALDTIPRDRPLALLLGNEESGLRPEVLAACETIATIPGAGTVESLNVAAAAAVLIYALSPG